MARRKIICLAFLFILFNICEPHSIHVNGKTQVITENNGNVGEIEDNSVVENYSQDKVNGEQGTETEDQGNNEDPGTEIDSQDNPEDHEDPGSGASTENPEDPGTGSQEEIVEAPVINIENLGSVRGRVLEGVEETVIYSYPRIPFAQPPVGSLRFKDPVKFEGEIQNNPIDELPWCVQRDSEGAVTGEENCLYLNVYTTTNVESEVTTELKPVMVFIHGGSFQRGNGGQDFYDPRFLLTKNIVLVTFNYRLGVFGFLNFNDPDVEVPGNAGLKDQKLALEWVRDNIEHFGGDPENVCIFGQDAGGVSVHLHVLSQLSAGLFHKGIIQSGTAISPWVLGVADNGVELAEELGISAGADNLLEQLQEAQRSALLDAVDALSEEFTYFQEFAGPVVEAEDDAAFLTKNPFEIIESGEFNHVPLLFGYNDAEGIYVDIMNRQQTGTSKLIEDFFDLVPSELDVERDTEKAEELANRIQQFYYGGLRPSLTNMRPFFKIFTDALSAFPTFRAVLEHVKQDDADDVYLYRFAADTRLNIYKAIDPINALQPGASHYDELGYLFYSEGRTPVTLTENEQAALGRVIDLWTAFAADGTPGINEWNAVAADAVNYANIETDAIELGVDPDEERMQFWNEVYEEFFRSDATLISGIPFLLATCFFILQYINN